MAAISAYLAAVALNALWQVSLLGAVAWGGSRLLMRRAPGAWLHRLWLATAAACALVPWLAAPWPGGEASRMPVAGVRLEAISSWLVRGQWWVAMDDRLLWALSGLVVVAGIGRMLRIGWAYGVARKLGRGARAEVPEKVAELARRRQERLGLSAVDLRVSSEVCGPVTVGIFHPVVILPEGLLERQGEEVTEAALAHEMVHVRRRDGARKLGEELLLALVAWHPMAQWLGRRLDHTRELACDEAAAWALEGGRRYSRSLVAIAADMASRPRTAAGLCSMGEGSLKQRVEQLVTGARRPSRWRLAAGAVALALATALAGSAVVVPGSGQAKRSALQVGELGEALLRYSAQPLLPPPPPPPPPPPSGKPTNKP